MNTHRIRTEIMDFIRDEIGLPVYSVFCDNQGEKEFVEFSKEYKEDGKYKIDIDAPNAKVAQKIIKYMTGRGSSKLIDVLDIMNRKVLLYEIYG